MTADLLIIGKYLLTQDAGQTVIEDGGLVIRGDTIIETGPAAELSGRYPGAELLVEEHGLIMPGLVNALSQAALSGDGSVGADQAARLTEEAAYDAALLVQAAMIKSGTTSFCLTGRFVRQIAKAAARTGMRGWLGAPVPARADDRQGAVARRDIDEICRLNEQYPLITGFVCLPPPWSRATELRQGLRKAAADRKVFSLVYLPENRVAARQLRERIGCWPVVYLERLGLLDQHLVVAPCVALAPAEIELIVKHQVKVVHCPQDDLETGTGISPLPELLTAGVAIGLGSGPGTLACNLDMFGAMNMAAKLQKLQTLDPTVLKAAAALAMATRGGAAVLAAGERLGSLAPGRKADLIILDLNQPHLTPLYNIPSHLVYAARGADVIHSVINGRVVMRNRRLTMM